MRAVCPTAELPGARRGQHSLHSGAAGQGSAGGDSGPVPVLHAAPQHQTQTPAPAPKHHLLGPLPPLLRAVTCSVGTTLPPLLRAGMCSVGTTLPPLLRAVMCSVGTTLFLFSEQ